MRSLFVALVLLAAPSLPLGSAAAEPSMRPEATARSTPGARAGHSKGRSRRHRKQAPGAPARLVRSGFHLTPRGSEVVLQTSAEVELQTREGKAGPTFVLRRCRATRANDRRSLDTRFFATSVTQIALRQHGADLEVRVTLKNAATASTRKEQGPGASWSWILEFADPAGGGRAPVPPPVRRPTDAPTATAAATPSVVD